MFVYLTASADAEYNASAYAYKIGSFSVVSERHLGWTVVEAYLHGYLALSTEIIKKHLYHSAYTYTVCTPSKPVIKLLTTSWLEVLHDNNWKDPEGKPVFYLSVLKELYYHRMFYKERNVNWDILTELNTSSYQLYELCVDKVKSELEVGE